jgi:hypothetical protein
MSDLQRQLDTYIKDIRPRYEDMLGQAVEIPSISMDPRHAPDVRRMAELAAQYLRAAGAETHISSRPRATRSCQADGRSIRVTRP